MAPASNQLSAATVALPLRLFLGISFLAAGLDKLTDPQFLDPQAGGYIGAQLTGFAAHSPLNFILTNLAIPNASLFGIVVLVGELAIGLGTIVGLFTRTAAFFGLVLSLMLWLTASWEVTPFFLGSDLPYAIGWLILLIAGAHPVFSLDGQIRKLQAQNQVRPGAEVVEGWNFPLSGPNSLANASDIARRRFLVITGSLLVTGMATGVAWAKTWHAENEGSEADTTTTPTNSNTSPQPNNTPGSAATTTVASTITGATPAASDNPTAGAISVTGSSATQPPAASSSSPSTQTTNPTTPVPNNPPTAAPAIKGTVLANVNSLGAAGSQKFTTPDTGESAILIRLSDGSVKAYTNICTHEGCEVSYVKSAQSLVCPCHGAQFSGQTGEVTRRPARRPLKSFNVQVDGSGNIVYTQV